MSDINLYGRVFLHCQIEAVTGLHIGGAAAAMAIGGLDNPVIRDTLTQRPYIPGSSLKGKMRSLTEKYHGFDQNRPIGKGVKIHICQSAEGYATCPVCHIYGVPGELEFSSPTRLVVRDAFLSEDSVKLLEAAKTDLPFSEVKWEAAIDRVTSAAVPRQIERVPAGAVFGPAELVYSVYEAADIDRFRNVVEGMGLLEDDYLGGLGSRGGGKVAFKNIALTVKSRGDYPTAQEIGHYPNLAALQADLDEVIAAIRERLPVAEG